ncbi:MAG TPA: hypothetical protein VEN79_15630 [Terriglobia bacterium]|nr:hypothetical protein [Terriglobia bacterium]
MNTLAQGRCVRHDRYGLGVVTQSDAERTSIDFQLHGPKKFVTKLMVVELSNEVLPPKPVVSKRRKKSSVQPSV